MESVRLSLRFDEEALHPMHRLVCTSPAIDREVILQGHAPGDTGTLLLYVKGDRDIYEGALESVPHVADFEVTPAGDGGFFVYARESMRPAEERLAAAFARETIVVVPPIEFRSDQTMRLTLVGDAGELQAAVDDLPDDVGVEVLRVGAFARSVGDALTDRQREAVEAARSVGYYEVPRENGIEAVAERLDCAPSTASDLLRRAEARLVEGALDVVHR